MLTSEKIRHLLGIILLAGNYLNGGTSRGRADGFSIDALAQIRTVKTRRGGIQQTLVDYLVQQMEETYPGELLDVLGPGGCASDVRDAARPILSDVLDELRGMQGRLRRMLKTLRSEELGQNLEFARHREVLSVAEAELEGLQQLFAQLEPRYAQLCAWFHVSPGANLKTDEFFGIFVRFLQDVDVARRQLDERTKASKVAELRRAQRPSIGQRGSLRRSRSCVVELQRCPSTTLSSPSAPSAPSASPLASPLASPTSTSCPMNDFNMSGLLSC